MFKSIAFAALALIASSANATGIKTQVFVCGGGAGEYAATVNVTRFDMSAPGGPMHTSYQASVTQSWLGGTHESGPVTVDTVFAMDGGPQYYFNKEAGFSLRVLDSKGVNAQGRSKRILVEASFKDPTTGMAGQVSRRWLNCR